ncbi:hypothetical protein [Rhodococcus oryzae]|uniref:hypothetical protein n=1 Tax=Rhodococcus oryzae TaxID=2571143 RepID=UPI0037BC8858
MDRDVVIWIVVIAAIVLLVAVAVWFARNARARHQRAEAQDIRERATEQSHEVGQEEALADETAARARMAEAEADAKRAEAERLQERARARATDAAKSREELDGQFERADDIDPDATQRIAPPDREPRA